jgi:predicted membrane GTPase involved in stress response
MSARYPIEQLARSTRPRFQGGFARMMVQLMPAFQDATIQATVQGLKILGVNEMALAEPREFLRHIHADDVQLGEPKVRALSYGRELHEPVMCARASVDSAHTEAVIHELLAREATIESVDWLHNPVVIRAEAPLRKVIGYPDVFTQSTQSTADLKMWLSHYARVVPGSSGDVA